MKFMFTHITIVLRDGTILASPTILFFLHNIRHIIREPMERCNDVDMRHSLSSQKRKRCHSNLWSFSSYRRWLEDVHRSELMQFFDIDRCYDFKEFLKGMRHDADAKVGTWMHVHLELRSDDKIWSRTKPRMGRKVPWSA